MKEPKVLIEWLMKFQYCCLTLKGLCQDNVRANWWRTFVCFWPKLLFSSNERCATNVAAELLWTGFVPRSSFLPFSFSPHPLRHCFCSPQFPARPTICPWVSEDEYVFADLAELWIRTNTNISVSSSANPSGKCGISWNSDNDIEMEFETFIMGTDHWRVPN